jgi:hypothetical protein
MRKVKLFLLKGADTLQLREDRHSKSAWGNNITKARDPK